MSRKPQQPAETLGHLIKAARKEKGWTQAELAEKVGVHSLSIIRWEADTSFPRGDDIQLALIKELGLPKELFTKRKNTRPAKQTENISPARKETSGEGTLGTEGAPKSKTSPLIDVISPYQSWHAISFLSPEEISDGDVIEYKIPPVIAYQGFNGYIFNEKHERMRVSRVLVNGKRLLPYYTWITPERADFGWGHTGGGARHLAESMLLDYFETMCPNEPEEALRTWVHKYAYNFKMDFVAWFDKQAWEIWSGAITAWLKEQKEQGDPAPEHSLQDVDYGWTGWLYRWDKYKGT